MTNNNLTVDTEYEDPSVDVIDSWKNSDLDLYDSIILDPRYVDAALQSFGREKTVDAALESLGLFSPSHAQYRSPSGTLLPSVHSKDYILGERA